MLLFSTSFGFESFFMIDFPDRQLYAKTFREICDLITRLDKMFQLSSFRQFLREAGKESKTQPLLRQTKLTVFLLKFWPLNQAYCWDFFVHFLRSKLESKKQASLAETLNLLASLQHNQDTTYKEVLTKVLPIYEEKGKQFSLVLNYFAQVYGGDQVALADFLVWVGKKGLKYKLESKFNELGI